MVGSKLDLFKNEWLDVVFENRNKEYGAYALRKFAAKATNIALFSVSAIVLIFVGIKAFNINIFPKQIVEAPEVVTPVTLDDLTLPEPSPEEEPLPQEETPPQRIAEEPPAVDLIRFPEPKVVDAKKVSEDIVSQDEIKEKNATPARITLKGTPGASGVPTGEFGPQKVEGAITGGTTGTENGDPNKVYDFEKVEVPASYPGGINEFRKFVNNAFVYPSGAIEASVKGTIELSFVIDKSGNLTEITVIRDLSHGTGEAAIKALKKSKKWNPAVQNGRNVPVRYSLPIRLDLTQM